MIRQEKNFTIGIIVIFLGIIAVTWHLYVKFPHTEERSIWMPVSYDVVPLNKYKHYYEFDGKNIYFNKYEDVKQDDIVLLHPEDFLSRFSEVRCDISHSDRYMIYFHKDEKMNSNHASIIYMTIMECEFTALFYKEKVVLDAKRGILKACYYDNANVRIPSVLLGVTAIAIAIICMYLFRYDIFEMK